MDNAIFSFPKPINEPVKAYAPGSSEKASLKKALAQLSSEEWDIPLVIGGKEIRTGNTGKVVMPHDHHHVLATYHKAGEKEVQMAIDAAMKAHKEWSELPWVERASVMLRVAELLSTKYRYILNASVMLGQSKNPFQAGNRRALRIDRFPSFQYVLCQPGIRRPALFGNRYTEPYGISCFGRFCVLAHAVQLYLYCF